ncbi:heavy metal translocating P-type ATPase [uncultured Aquabacterium sp.]
MNTTQQPSPVASHDDPALLLAVRGMTCAACVSRVERALRKVPGVAQAQVNFATETASVVLASAADEALVPDAARLIAAIEAAGYHAQLQEADHPLADEHASWWSVWGAVCLGALASVPLMLPMLWGDHHFWPAWVQFALATPVQFGLGARFYRAGWAALRDGSGNMDQLVALGTSAAWGLSVWLWWQHGLAPASGAHGHAVGGMLGAMPDATQTALYFESSAVVITLVLLGKALEARAKRQTTLAIRSLQSLRPDTVRRLGPQGEVEVPLAQVLVGDVLVVMPGARVPCDGLVQEGGSHVDESLLTGEPLPVAKHVGDRLTGGAINAEGRLLMRVTAVGGQTMLAHIIRRVVEAQASKAPIQRVVDRVSAVFVPTVLVIALLTGLGWWLAGQGAEVALIRAVAVLVIACPCALGLATPAAIMAGTGAAARQGILIQDPQALEVAHRVQLVAFDKTGTLTQGQPRLLDWAVALGTGLSREQALQFAAALQRGSEHPLARAVQAAADGLPADPLRATQSRAVPGRGIEGVVPVVGAEAIPAAWAGSWCLGSPRWMQELTGQDAPADVAEAAARWSADGATVSWLLHAPAAWRSDDGKEVGKEAGGDGNEARGWQVVAALAFGDALKPGAAQAVARLHALGVRTVIVSGDSRQAAQAIARQVGIQEVIAEVLPGDKADHIRRLQRDANGRAVTVAMVGDGLNDAPALAAADIGMAMANPQGGTDVAMQAAGITLMRGDPMLVPAALEVSRRTSRKIWQNLGWAFGYNVIGIPLAALGGLNPMLAGAAMALSSVSVVSNALWLSRWRPPAALGPST